jgi:hypothetical protein
VQAAFQHDRLDASVVQAVHRFAGLLSQQGVAPGIALKNFRQVSREVVGQDVLALLPAERQPECGRYVVAIG